MRKTRHRTELIASVIREHATGRVEPVGSPKLRIGKWIAAVTVAAGLSSVALASGAVVNGEFGSAGEVETPVVSAVARQAPQGLAASRDVPYLSPDFFDVAKDAIAYNSGLSLDDAAQILDEMEDAGQNCARSRAGGTGRSCVFHSHGVTLRYDYKNNDHVYVAKYASHSRDGRADIGPGHGAIQMGDRVQVTAPPKTVTYPVPRQTKW
jgi:hypothetical protein